MEPFVVPGLVVAACSLSCYLLLRFVVAPARIARIHADTATVRWVPTPPGPEHGRHRPLVAEYQACGYRVHGCGHIQLGPIRTAVTLLAHDDLSVVDVVGRTGGLAASITTLLADGTSVLETMAVATTPAAPGRLLQVFPGAGPAELVARHRQTLTWLAARGITATGHVHGPPGVFEAAPHLLGRVPAPTPRQADALTRGLVRDHDGPLAERWDVEDQLRVAGLLAVGWPAPTTALQAAPEATAPPAGADAPVAPPASDPSPWTQAV